MPLSYTTPGVHIEEVTGPGVISGVGTSTAAFLGPAVAGPVGEPRRVSSFDEYLSLFGTLADGTVAPHITIPRRFFLSHAVRGFFENGGAQAYVLRVGTARQAEWAVRNRAGTPEVAFLVAARTAGSAGNGVTVSAMSSSPGLTGASGVALATAGATVSTVDGTLTRLMVTDATPFRVGDAVTVDQAATAVVAAIDPVKNLLALRTALAGVKVNDHLTIADVDPATTTLRLARLSDAQTLFPGSIVLIKGKDAAAADAEEYALVLSVNRSSGVLTLSGAPKRTKTFRPSAASPTTLNSQEFDLAVTSGGVTTAFKNLSLNPDHPRWVLRAVDSDLVTILPPPKPPTASTFPAALVATGNAAQSVSGVDDSPGSLTVQDFTDALIRIKDVEDINIVCIPDASSHPSGVEIQQALIGHCTDPEVLDRVAVLDPWPGAPTSGPGSVEEHREKVESPSGFAALYYPWLTVRDPSSPPSVPATILIPPCGHIAGVYARIDNDRGVHKAPANTEVRGVLGLERIVSDRQQGPLNDEGVNVLRVFPGSGTVTVWGARTTVRKDITDWRYVSTRRLLIFIEQSLEEGLRFAVFEPNNPSLWARLRRQVDEFLTRVWESGALFGESASQAFYVRIDEALNPPATQALGQLHIEIGVRPSYPAEFVIVRIGLWDGQV